MEFVRDSTAARKVPPPARPRHPRCPRPGVGLASHQQEVAGVMRGPPLDGATLQDVVLLAGQPDRRSSMPRGRKSEKPYGKELWVASGRRPARSQALSHGRKSGLSPVVSTMERTARGGLP